jgi:hypothetical protein
VRPTRRWKRKWDFLAYFAIALVIVASALLYGAHQGRTGGSSELPLKWLGFAGLTAIVFGYATRTGLETKAGPKFWVLLAAVFVVRTAIWVLVLAQVEEVPLVVYALAGGPEYMLLLNVLGAFLKPEK